MKKTVLITGTSSGIGKASAAYFAEYGWNVGATMRSPEKETFLQQYTNLKLIRLDVTDSESIKNAIEDTIKTFGGIDVVINNAGYGGVGVFEAASKEQIQRQFDTNVFGVMNVIREILPYFREKRGGVIINVTSMGGLITFPIYSVYHATKWAVEGFSESLQYELRRFNIKIKNVEPGAIKTDFYERSMDLFKKEGLNVYDDYVNVTYKNTQKAGEDAPEPIIVARKIFKAANEDNFTLRYPVGNQSSLLLLLRRVLPLNLFSKIVRFVVENGLKK